MSHGSEFATREVLAPALRIQRLNARYGSTPVLFDIGCSWPARGCVGVLGRNGAGKTSLMRAIVGQGIDATGSLEILGRDVSHWTTSKRIALGIGYAPQEGDVFARLTVRENLRIGALRQGKNSNFDSVLQQFPRLAERLDQAAGTLSGGERKMLAIARALLQKPSILILDEPTEGVWHTVVDEFSNIVKELSLTLLVVLVEQHVKMVMQVATECVVLDRGRIALAGTTAQICDDARLHQLLTP